jgi:hypothetical protein
MNHCKELNLFMVSEVIYQSDLAAAVPLARMFHESHAATTHMAVLPAVLGCRPLRRTVQVRLETNTLRLPGGTRIFVVSRLQFMKHPG